MARTNKMNCDPDYDKAMSLKLSEVMENIGVTQSMVENRRRTYMLSETLDTMTTRMKRGKDTYYVFGSQSEGTTTLDLGSDIDTVICSDDWPVMLDMSEWNRGTKQLLMIKNDQIPPRHCMLQMIKENVPEPVTTLAPCDCALDYEGRVVFKNTFYEVVWKTKLLSDGKQYIKNGPSGSYSEQIDIIFAFKSTCLPAECLSWLHRPRPGHWPTNDVIEKAMKVGTFILPVGHPESLTNKLEWRFSTSLTERLLMHSLNMVQIKCYIILKMIKKEIFKPIVGDHLTSFHCKTCVLFTAENSPKTIWQEDNLLPCVQFCLRTLLRFLRSAYCPHYTIQCMNLFIGKLPRWEQIKLANVISNILQDSEGTMKYLCTIRTERVGAWLLNLTSKAQTGADELPNMNERHSIIAGMLIYNIGRQYWERLEDIFTDMCRPNCSIDNAIDKVLANLAYLDEKIETGRDLEKSVGNFLKPYLCSTLSSLQSSLCAYHGIPPSSHTIKVLFDICSDSMLPFCKLKEATVSYSSGDFRKAVSILEAAEETLDNFNLEGNEAELNITNTGREICPPDQLDKEITNDSLGFPVMFLRQEEPILPDRLVYEMFRTIAEEDVQHRSSFKYMDKWMDLVVVDCQPYLYYLQYLSYMNLGNRNKQTSALLKLEGYIREYINRGYVETSMNLLGHCFELENRFDMAVRVYSSSLELLPLNNAARWHIVLLLFRLSRDCTIRKTAKLSEQGNNNKPNNVRVLYERCSSHV